jgi:hypothetical protein
MVIPTAEPSETAFPAGPRYGELLDSDPRIAWIRFKVWTADWYTETLGALGTRLGGYDRQVGIEMAIDGALGSLSGAFDASVALVIVAAERSLNISEADQTKPHKYGWGRFKDRIRSTPVESLAGVPKLDL